MSTVIRFNIDQVKRVHQSKGTPQSREGGERHRVIILCSRLSLKDNSTLLPCSLLNGSHLIKGKRFMEHKNIV